MMVPVIWPSYHAATSRHGSWDMGLLEELFDGKLWSPVKGHDYVHFDTFKEVGPMYPGAVVVLPGQHHAQDIPALNEDLGKFRWVLLVLVGDEESLFDVSAVSHPRIKFWIQSRRTVSTDGSSGCRFLPWGFPQGTKEGLKPAAEKKLSLFYSGQFTHSRRKQCSEALRRYVEGLFIDTLGFTQGLPRDRYLQHMSGAKIAPCPAGCVTPDSFRVWEALEAGCLPIVDAMSPRPDACPTPHWWNILLGQEPGFPIVSDWSEAPAIIERELECWPEGANRSFAWWQKYKRELAYRLRDDINEVSLRA